MSPARWAVWAGVWLCGLAQAGQEVPVAASASAAVSAAAPATLRLAPCTLYGYAFTAQCGTLRRPLNASQPQGTQIDIHVAVLPAVARQRLPDPVVFLAGGPGQSAIELAGSISRLMGRFLNRRDLILVDQRGTGRSAPLYCASDEASAAQPLSERADPARQVAELQACREQLAALPYGDLRQFSTPAAMADLEAVRQALGLGPINLVGVSYGTRAALDYLRQFPASVRRVVLDGVAPPDMVLPISFAVDTQAALEALLADCEHEPACAARYPHLRRDWQALQASLPREVAVAQPLTGRSERLRLTPAMLMALVRMPLYSPLLASALPLAITEAAQGRFTALIGLSQAGMGAGRGHLLATGMHFSVVCSEDWPRLAQSPDHPSAAWSAASSEVYRQACAAWPHAVMPAAFYQVPRSPAPVLLLSGGLDPATPPRHAQRVAQALGPQAVSVVVPQMGHGVMAGVACWRDAVHRFVDAATDSEALSLARKDAACAAQIPRPPALIPLELAP